MNIHKIKNKIEFNKEETSKAKSQDHISSSRQKLIKLSEKLMTLIGLSGQTLFYFQAFKIYTVGSAKDVSALGFSFALVSLICWLLYGILIKNKVLIIVNAFAALGASLTLLAIFLVS